MLVLMLLGICSLSKGQVQQSWRAGEPIAPNNSVQQSADDMEVEWSTSTEKKNGFGLSVGVNYGALQNLATFSGLRVDVVPGGTTRTEKTTTPANLMVELLWQRRSWLAWSLAVSVGEAEASYYDSRGVLLGTTEYVPFAVSLGLRTRYVAIGRFSAYGVWGLNYCGGVMSNDYYNGEPKMAGLDAVLIDCYPFNFAFGRSHGLAMGVGVGSRGIFNLNYFVNF